jgi:hypothetical protein
MSFSCSKSDRWSVSQVHLRSTRGEIKNESKIASASGLGDGAVVKLAPATPNNRGLFAWPAQA